MSYYKKPRAASNLEIYEQKQKVKKQIAEQEKQKRENETQTSFAPEGLIQTLRCRLLAG